MADYKTLQTQLRRLRENIENLPAPRDEAERLAFTPLADSFEELVQVFWRRIREPRIERVVTEHRPLTVLIIEDDDDFREDLEEHLGLYFSVSTARTVEEALLLIAKTVPDAIVSDYSLPNGGALVLLHELQRNVVRSALPVLVLSGHEDAETKVRAFEAGAVDYIVKPSMLVDELVARVRNALARSDDLRAAQHLQETDDLTHLGNRRGLVRFLNAAVAAATSSGTDLAVVMADNDGLKRLNDGFGHAVGDEAIRSVARAINSCKRTSDFAARLGGDEFVIAMPQNSAKGAQRFIERIQSELSASPLILPNGAPNVVQVSFGFATLAERSWAESPEELMARADKALYEQKALRGSRTTTLDPSVTG